MFFTTRQLAVFIVLASLCVAIQLSPRIGNVEFTSIITFTMGVFFGGFIGGIFGGTVMFINGFLSPWGVAGFIMPFQLVGMVIVGVAGGVYRRYGVEKNPRRLLLESAILGAFLTLIYDVITNSGVAIQAIINSGVPIQAQSVFLTIFLFGIPMSVLHVVSNIALFGFAFPPLTKAIHKFM